MEETKVYDPSSDQVNMTAAYLRPREVPDTGEDMQLIRENFRDPNLDLRKLRRRSPRQQAADMAQKKAAGYSQSEIDVEGYDQYESDRFSSSRAESRNSTAIEFDE